ncbi:MULTISPECIES: sensor histidine kinase [unclassified Curtobacterium]|uniref:sensor histidine kinase n=1 Tax=unclassified Curtobacterium TaxID=257496 RepID=UPI000F4ACA0A|nr:MULTISPECIES: histidine kinase [unclassified Curtobacterium]ROQ17823.1 signal transduction histidine kinase [Curtobacterium sp. PhB171]ROQ28932.1 signal transduction histidine kinase [Curtobacterium sp. PhB170]ROS45924.1 signal transduction histidine kinase [Curtobacterium sp. PhB131]ROS67774.1 signal transduction histidine kinase [Curtobacterium sp. PhB141]
MADRPTAGRVRRVLAATDGRLDLLVDAGLRWVRTRRAAWWLLDVLFVAAALADAVLDISGATTLETVLSLVAAAALLLRRRFPVLAFALTVPGLFVGSAVVAASVALFTLGERTDRRWLMLLAALVQFVGFGGFVGPPQSPGEIVVSVVYALIFALGPLAVGLLVQTRARLTGQLVEVHRAREDERRQAAAVALSRERALLAREMHDVVSHQVTLIAVQAGAMQMAGRDEAERGFARTIRQLCVVTLQELREMVQVLRASGGTDRQIAPQPVLADLPRLIAESGLETRATVDLPDTLAQPLQRAVYRFVQEGLTNVRKHAPDATVRVSGRVSAGHVLVDVVNGPARAERLELPGSGLGLIGLGERASLLGGSMDSGPQPDDGFALHLRLPVGHLQPTAPA